MATATTMSPGLQGVAAMASAAAILTVHDTGTKLLLELYPINQLVTVRQLFSLLILSVIIQFTSGWQVLRVTNKPAMAWRAVTFISTTVLIVASLEALPIATVLAIVFASPLIVAVLSVPFLGERVGPRRWIAIAIGFLGVLIILRPVSPGFEALLLIPVAAAISSGFRDLVTRWLSRTDSSISILYWSNLATVIAGTLTIPLAWNPMAAEHYALLFVLAILNTTAHFLMIYALRMGDAALVSPFRYTALVWAVLLGYLVWGHLPDQWTLLGSAVVVASGVFLAIREAQTSGWKWV